MVLVCFAVASSSSESFARASLRSLPEQHLLPYQERNNLGLVLGPVRRDEPGQIYCHCVCSLMSLRVDREMVAWYKMSVELSLSAISRIVIFGSSNIPALCNGAGWDCDGYRESAELTHYNATLMAPVGQLSCRAVGDGEQQCSLDCIPTESS